MRIISFCFIASINLAFSQSSFIDSTSRWHEDATFDSGVVPDSVHYQDYEYFFLGDSIVNTKYFFKLFKMGIDSAVAMDDPNHGYGISSFYEYMGLVREDSTTHKVYFIQRQSAYEALLYDFSLTAGDTVPYSYGFPNCTPGNIYNADTFYFAGQPRQRLFVLSTNIRTGGVRIFQGIGANCGLLGLMCIYYDGIYACMHDYSNSTDTIHFINCSAVDAIVEVENAVRVSVFPNPFRTTVNLEFNLPVEESVSYSLYSYLGEKVSGDVFIAAGNNSIDLGSLKNGIYLLTFRFRNATVCKRIVKQEF